MKLRDHMELTRSKVLSHEVLSRIPSIDAWKLSVCPKADSRRTRNSVFRLIA